MSLNRSNIRSIDFRVSRSTLVSNFFTSPIFSTYIYINTILAITIVGPYLCMHMHIFLFMHYYPKSSVFPEYYMRQKGRVFFIIIWTRIVFLTGQVIFVP